jgi:clan AA aspartic protease
MGYVYSEIILRNAADIAHAKRGIIREQDIHEAAVTALVDTGSITLVINEAIRQQLGLLLEEDCDADLADGSRQKYALSEPIQVQWKNRKKTCQAIVVPNAKDVLLGVIPLEALDVIVDPVQQELVGAHGDKELHMLK